MKNNPETKKVIDRAIVRATYRESIIFGLWDIFCPKKRDAVVDKLNDGMAWVNLNGGGKPFMIEEKYIHKNIDNAKKELKEKLILELQMYEQRVVVIKDKINEL